MYTRKSSEEGLDMVFNSLDAQREAGLDYIKSQRSHGWVAIDDLYDDGGFSGGNTERPGLKRLLADIRSQRVDIVVVYKVDRLSRSLTDFARLMQTFDEHSVSFVSVTQQFNTTTSMGRLTLNMLLSFAQFEREIAGERIRDKVAATKRKGLFVGGNPPLGYRRPMPSDPNPANKVLRVVPEEAAIVRRIYALYLESGSPLGVAKQLEAEGTPPPRPSKNNDRSPGDKRWDTSVISRVLTNAIYIGQIVHVRGHNLPKGKGRGTREVWPGQHEAIIDRATWDRVRARMDQAKPRAEPRWTHTHLLKKKLKTIEGVTMTPANTANLKGDRGKHIVRYYISLKACKQGYRTCPIGRVNAGLIDDLVRAMVLDRLEAAHGLILDEIEATSRDHWVREIIESVVLGLDHIDVALSIAQIRACADALGEAARAKPNGRAGDRPRRRCHFTPQVRIEPSERQGIRGGREVLTTELQIKRHDGRRLLLSPEGRDLVPRLNAASTLVPSPHIVRAIGQAFVLHEAVMRTRGEVNAIADQHGIHRSRVHHLLHLTRLSPAAIRAALTGTLSPRIALEDLHDAADSLDWSLQAVRLGLPTHGS
ncbi:MAG: recombinase family protein [Phycisphaeraceae bacterium]|nr:MAG: recombinase family protein [Phycisphaeraceae bacterium]